MCARGVDKPSFYLSRLSEMAGQSVAAAITLFTYRAGRIELRRSSSEFRNQ
jgi:hypothetical protein